MKKTVSDAFECSKIALKHWRSFGDAFSSQNFEKRMRSYDWFLHKYTGRHDLKNIALETLNWFQKKKMKLQECASQALDLNPKLKELKIV